ncbi:DUF6714 family protein [Pseudomarimonas arenosa]|uniref:DUF6714 family protein n=1 Tax=Pseudomarimonas arenosa TaxID=2774145 RepID=UPI003CCD1FAA
MSDSIERLICGAFENTSLEAHTPISVDTYDDEGTESHFVGTHWTDHNATTLQKFASSLLFFTPEAAAHFLPAFLLATLQAPESNLAESTIRFLSPPKGDASRPSFDAWWSLLSRKQQLAVVAFLRRVPEAWPGEHDASASALEGAVHVS